MQVWHSHVSNAYNVFGEFECLKIWICTCWSNDCKHGPVYQTFVESILALKFEILEGSSQTCIKVNVQEIIDSP